MSQAETLLASLTDETVIHEHPVTDPDGYFIIDPNSRAITSVGIGKNILMQNDHDSERYTFELPRLIEGHNMLKCNRVKVHYNNIDASGKREYASIAELTDLAASLEDPSVVTCSWLIPREATQYAGILSFLVQFMCKASDGTVVYEWHTDFYNDVEVKPTRNNGEQPVVQYNDLLESWHQRLFGSKDSVMADIVAESDAIKESIELKGEETLATIPSDYTEMYNTLNTACRTHADAIVNSASGEVITVNDSSDNYVRGLKLFGKTTQVTTTGKNLFNANRIHRGTNIVVDGNKITITPLSTGQAVDSECPLSDVLKANAGDTVIISGKTTGINRLYITGTNTSWLWGTPLTLTAEMLSSSFYLYGGSSNGTPATITDLQVELGEVTTEYEPYSGGYASPSPDWPQPLVSVGDSGSINATVCGKNLIMQTATNQTITGVKFTVNENGSITANGRAIADTFFEVGKIAYRAGKTYIVSGCPASGSMSSYCIYIGNNNVYAYDTGSGAKLTPTLDTTASTVRILIRKDVTVSNLIFWPMMRFADIADDSYKVPTIQTLTAQTPNGLPGIPVTSGGNYTDSNGQKWVCDEVDFARGVYVQRIGEVRLDGVTNGMIAYAKSTRNMYTNAYLVNTELWGRKTGDDVKIACSHYTFTGVVSDSSTVSDEAVQIARGSGSIAGSLYIGHNNIETTEEYNVYLADQYAAGTPVTVIYELAQPIETPLSAAELATYAAPHTNKPNTTVYNDAGAYMALEYNADTKLYIDNKFAELQNAILTNHQTT